MLGSLNAHTQLMSLGLMGFPVNQLDPLCWDSRDSLPDSYV